MVKKIPRTDKIVDIARWLMIELGDLLYEGERKRDEIDTLIYRLKDDKEFREIVSELNNFSPQNYQKVKDYIELLKK